MIVRLCFLATVASLIMVSQGGLFDQDQHSEVDLNDTPYFENEPAIETPKSPPDEGRSRRLKRSSWSLPPNTSMRYVIDWIIPVTPLNNTFTFFTFDLIYRFVLPTYAQLSTLYGTLGRLSEDEMDDNLIDYEFLEEQRANDERRTVYQQVEGIFEKMGFDGHTCLLRAMCELAETPLAHHGLLGKLIDLVFSPNILQVPKSMESYVYSNRIKRHAASIPELELLQRPLEDDYTTAYQVGKKGKCWTRYFSCPVSVFKIISAFGDAYSE